MKTNQTLPNNDFGVPHLGTTSKITEKAAEYSCVKMNEEFILSLFSLAQR
jgi:hypothetical protein